MAAAVIALLAAGGAGRPHVVIVGGGWAGFGAADAIARARLPVDVTLLEAAAQPGGLAAGWRTAGGRAVEAGVHGFWRNYRNIDRVVGELGIEPFTPYTPSALYTRAGLSVVAPILGELPRLPAPLGTALWPEFKTMTRADQLTAAPLVAAFLDFDGSDRAWRRYDGMTARELFAPLSAALYSQFIEPMLLTLPMCPGEDCSAAAALSLFSYFALEHQADFDVRWLRGSASTTIFAPWAARLDALSARAGCGAVRVLYGKRLVDVAADSGGAVTAVRTADGDEIACDALISAVGISAAQKIATLAPGLARARAQAGGDFASLEALRAVDVVAVRLWLRRAFTPPHASNVCGGGLAPGLETTGFTFYDLGALQDDFKPGGAGGAAGSVLELDFYYAAPLLEMDERALVATALRALRTACPATYASLGEADVEDCAVVRVPAGVSHFAPGCYSSLPAIRSTALRNWWWAGDWVDRGGHRSWSQEKALVTGMQAARAAVAHTLGARASARVARPLPVEPDEPQLAIGRAAVRAARDAFGFEGAALGVK